MTDVTFAVVGVEPEPYSVTPVLNARLGIAAVGDDPIQTIALRCQVRIETMRRGYSDDEGAGHCANLDRVRPAPVNRGTDDHVPAPRGPVRACSRTDNR